ncbi:ABC transporter permease [Deinococcus radiopugnans]|uniref:ABC transport system permease protein n=1 Tax=Deinococcus radiopugnans ATCC 19172 TaxID=585398 RepID=A0A5C4Y7C7_9DEIO|nr:iron export ABC transporter permease subunit FetB [Deinococcus radiopugnans]MBB6015128.1 putative ABC transport system permease protein [Deinococcus radiopugnans ATCC 19172]TNM70911.1 iron export ABC transporter permease subunit FetB [Deinococcus radiopugnans ATCC 19172]
MSVPISLFQVVLAAALMLLSALLSWRLRLGLGRDILTAGTRMTVQLLLVGLILGWVFALRSPWPILGIGLVMTVLAAQAAVGRTRGRYPGIFLDAFAAIFGSSFVLTGLTLGAVLQIRPWFEAQYAVPILGMVLGNTLTGVSLALDRFTSDLGHNRSAIEERLALGATRWEAARGTVRAAVRTGMLPTLNSMAVMGIVSLPGMMTGQILAGASPAVAVRYQIVIMFVLAASSALGSLGAVLLAYRALLDSRDRLRGERLKAPR